MQNTMIVSSAPHQVSNSSVSKIMLDVLIALLPATICAVVFFGLGVLLNVAICVVSCVVFEYLYTALFTKDWNPKYSTIRDLSAVVTGLLLALNLPAAMPWWQIVLGSAFAILVVKMLFGGIGKNFVNPALAARVFMLVAFASAMGAVSQNAFVEQITGATGEVTATATYLASKAATITPLNMLLGTVNSAAVGEVSKIALLAGGVYLCIRRVIDFRLPLIILLSGFVFAFVFFGLGETGVADMLNVSLAQLLSGGLVFGAIFMATDYSTSPNTMWGNIIYGIMVGFFTIMLRKVGVYPEGCSFAIILCNLFVPLLDKYIKNKPFGYKKPAKVKAAKEAK